MVKVIPQYCIAHPTALDLARADGYVHVQGSTAINEHDDLHFYCKIIVRMLSSLILKVLTVIRRKKDIQGRIQDYF